MKNQKSNVDQARSLLSEWTNVRFPLAASTQGDPETNCQVNVIYHLISSGHHAGFLPTKVTWESLIDSSWSR